MTGHLLRFARDGRGVAAVELALVLPVLAAMFLGVYGLWDAASRRQDLRSSLTAGAEYYINGGTDDATARQVIQSAWPHQPTDSSIDLTRNCKCGTTPLICTSTCADGSAPSTYVTMSLRANDPAAPISQAVLESRVVRVR